MKGTRAVTTTRHLLIKSPLLALMLAPLPALAIDPTPWVGKYPFDKIGGKTLWEGLGQTLDATIGATLAGTIRRGWGPETVVVQAQGWVIALSCKAHDCSDNQVTVAISPSGRVIACTFVNDERDRGTWREAGRPPIALNQACPEGDAMIPALRRAGLLDRSSMRSQASPSRGT